MSDHHVAPQSIPTTLRSRTITDLPNELLVNVFKQLDGRTLEALRHVSQRFAYLLKQERLLYRHGVFTRLGVRFPRALDPLPFLTLPDLGITPARDQDVLEILRHLERLEIRPHQPSDCVMFDLMWDKKAARAAIRLLEGWWSQSRGISETDLSPTLLVELLSPDGDRPSAADQEREKRGHLSTLLHEVSDDVHDEDSKVYKALRFSAPGPGDHTVLSRKGGCCYLDHTILDGGWTFLRKVVVRNAPVMLYDVTFQELSFPHNLHVLNHSVFVVNSGALWPNPPSSFCVEEGEDDTPILWGLGPLPPGGSAELTIVFWTGDPDAAWLPPCSHFSMGPRLEHENDMLSCTAMAQIWHGLMRMIHYARDFCNCAEAVNLVNIESTIDLSDSLTTPLPHDVPPVAAYLQARFPEMFNNPESIYDPPRLLTMQEWIEEGHADDVFTSEELAPFLST